MLRSIKARIQKIERLLPGPVEVLLDDGTTAALPPRTNLSLLVGVLAEARTGCTPDIVARHADVLEHVVSERRDADGSIMPLLRVLREGMRDLREQHDEHQPMEELQ
jgi:hypothetical protein